MAERSRAEDKVKNGQEAAWWAWLVVRGKRLVEGWLASMWQNGFLGKESKSIFTVRQL